MAFWKAKVENSSHQVARQLRSIVISQQRERLVARINFADGSFFDIESDRVPQFNLGETLTLDVYANIDTP